MPPSDKDLAVKHLEKSVGQLRNLLKAKHCQNGASQNQVGVVTRRENGTIQELAQSDVQIAQLISQLGPMSHVKL